MKVNRPILFSIVLIATFIFSVCRHYNFYNRTLSTSKTSTKILPLNNDVNPKTTSYGSIFNNEVQNNICQIATADTFKLNKIIMSSQLIG